MHRLKKLKTIVLNEKGPFLHGPFSFKMLFYFVSINSTSKISVAFGGITAPAPRAP